MTIIDTKSPSDQQLKTVHLLPCKIAHNGPAKVSQFFNVQQAQSGNYLESTFRGRLLKGTQLSLKEIGLSGLVSQEEGSKFTEDGEIARVFKATKIFDSVTFWEHDFEPHVESNSTLKSVTQWPSLAHAIHKPVDSSTNQGTQDQVEE